MTRPSWDAYFLKLASTAAERSTCLHRQIGAVITVDNQLIATGYNGSPSGHRNCCDYGSCLRDELKIASGTQTHICYAIHAELNAILQAAKHGRATKGATMYVNTQPCDECAKAIIGAGIKVVYWQGKYPNSNSENLFEQSQVDIVVYEEENK